MYWHLIVDWKGREIATVYAHDNPHALMTAKRLGIDTAQEAQLLIPRPGPGLRERIMTVYEFEIDTPTRTRVVEIKATSFENAVAQLRVKYPMMTSWHSAQ